jgi:hypothetical protein
MPHYLNNDKNNMITTQEKSTLLFFVPFQFKVYTIHGQCSPSMVDFFLMFLRDSNNSNLEKVQLLEHWWLRTFCLPILN